MCNTLYQVIIYHDTRVLKFSNYGYFDLLVIGNVNTQTPKIGMNLDKKSWWKIFLFQHLVIYNIES